MIHELIIVCILFAITLINIGHYSQLNQAIDMAIMSSTLLTAKYNAVSQNKREYFTVHSNVHQQSTLSTSLSNCELAWSKNATASLAGTCQSNQAKLTLRVGEGGIGYPWQACKGLGINGHGNRLHNSRNHCAHYKWANGIIGSAN